MILGLALIPPKQLQDEVNAYRKRYDQNYAKIMPHITIKGQFEIPDEALENVKEEIKRRVAGKKDAEVHATKVSSFAPTTNVIYFKVEKHDSLEALYDAFNDEDFYGTSEHPFVPHFTIAQGLTSQEFEDIYSQLRLAGVDLEETVTTLSLLYFDTEEDKWKVVDTFDLA